MKEFRDRVAVVTGAASGIGRAMAERFAAEGMKVVLADVEEEALARAESELKAKGAAVAARRTGVSRGEDWEWVLGVNLWGVIHGVRVFVPIMLRQGDDCHIVNTASGAGLHTRPWLAMYCASKHAVVALSESLHHELALTGSRVKVSVLCPAVVNTRIGESERNR